LNRKNDKRKSQIFSRIKKTDDWLVKTVAGYRGLYPFLSYSRFSLKTGQARPTKVLAMSCCFLLSAIDIYFVLNKTILFVYLPDAVAEILLLAS
jgi:hypothetical protein